MTDLGPDARDALAAFRRSHERDANAVDASWNGIAGRIATEREPRSAPERGSADAGARRIAVVALAFAAAALVVAFLAPHVSDAPAGDAQPGAAAPYQAAESASAGPEEWTHAQPESSRPRGRDPSPGHDEPVGQLLSIEPARPPTDGPSDAEQGNATPPVPRDVTRKPERPKMDVAAESDLVGDARAALRDHEPERALSLLQRHAKEHPDGELIEERAVLEIVALCDLGRTAAASRRARAFLRRHPSSPLAAHVLRTCASP